MAGHIAHAPRIGVVPPGPAQLGTRSRIVTSENPCRRSSMAAAIPPTPAPIITTRSERGPVIYGSLCAGGGALRALASGHAPLEALDPAAGIHQLLLARVERVTGGTDLHVNLGLGRAGHELVAAGAADVSFHVLRMNVCLHTTEFSQGLTATGPDGAPPAQARS